MSISILKHLNRIPTPMQGGCVAVGNFDGVHQGHASLVGHLVEIAKQRGGPAIVITFDPPPIAILHPEVPLFPPLTTIERRAELLESLGVDGLIALPTNPGLLDLSPNQFFEEVLVAQLRIMGMVEGPNFRFGKDRTGDTELLTRLCQSHGVVLHIANAMNDGAGVMISSSRIRNLLKDGEIEAANAMLTQPFRISGLVTRGAGRGRQMLVPTANLTDVGSLVPSHGVYAGIVRLDGIPYRAAVNIGPNPTFHENQSKIEIHLLDWQGDLYGRSIDCDLMLRVRGVKKFESKEALLDQIRSDIRDVSERIAI